MFKKLTSTWLKFSLKDKYRKTRISIAYCFSIYDKAVSILRLVTNLVKFKTFNNLPKI
ncbi:hypothetical protein WANA34_0465 [Wolbachia endosymbiont of Drosophila ananassae]|nr:hypothetical protein WANA34_0465 [Wolbachia endosymbiont of Drosophila ananassae]